jgi:hypothetical protein
MPIPTPAAKLDSTTTAVACPLDLLIEVHIEFRRPEHPLP